MAEEFELDLEGSEDINKTELRIKNLSSKVRETSTERDEAKKSAEEAEARALAAEKKVEFLGSFTDISAKYHGASEYRDAIETKVQAGYSVEDATVSVLNAEGKLTQPQSDPQPITAGGGSAATILTDTSQRSVGEMTQAERREALLNPEIQGELEAILRGQR
jgi:hypothetical protein